ncbi:hypothetical protein ACQKMN_09590 [Ureibacillus composti]
MPEIRATYNFLRMNPTILSIPTEAPKRVILLALAYFIHRRNILQQGTESTQ